MTIGIVIKTLVVFVFIIITFGCSGKEESTPEPQAGGFELSAQEFAQLYLDLQKVDRKNAKILDSFLKRNNIEEGEYRLAADSVFIEDNPQLVEEYRNIITRYEDEKDQALMRFDVDVEQYEVMLLALSTGEKPEWADSVVDFISDTAER